MVKMHEDGGAEQTVGIVRLLARQPESVHCLWLGQLSPLLSNQITSLIRACRVHHLPLFYIYTCSFANSAKKYNKKTRSMPSTAKHHLLTLPAEIREQVYREILHPDANRHDVGDGYSHYDYRQALSVFGINRQIYYESRKVFRDLNVFVRIQTPWPEAEDHVQQAGMVPILIRGERARLFTNYHLNATVEPSRDWAFHGASFAFVIHIDDLSKFTQIWFYDGLSNPGMNSQLSLDLALNDPYAPGYEEPYVQKNLQRRLLLPFGRVKGLRTVDIKGSPTPLASIQTDVRAEQAVAPTRPEKCLSEAIRYKDEGNECFKKTHPTAADYHAALAAYTKAWEAIHIVVRGHSRHLHAEVFFHCVLAEPFAGKNGSQERMTLRVTLVANTCHVYLKLKEWEECRFWGMRTITMLRESRGLVGPEMDGIDIPPEVEALTGMPGAEPLSAPLGKTYYRTALAVKELGDEAHARRLLRVALIYLPNNAAVKEAMASVALRLG